MDGLIATQWPIHVVIELDERDEGVDDVNIKPDCFPAL